MIITINPQRSWINNPVAHLFQRLFYLSPVLCYLEIDLVLNEEEEEEEEEGRLSSSLTDYDPWYTGPHASHQQSGSGKCCLTFAGKNVTVFLHRPGRLYPLQRQKRLVWSSTGRRWSWRSFIQTQTQTDVKQRRTRRGRNEHSCDSVACANTRTHTHMCARTLRGGLWRFGLLHLSTTADMSIQINTRGHLQASPILLVNPERIRHIHLFDQRWIYERVPARAAHGSRFYGPHPWLLEYTWTSVESNTASLGTYVWRSRHQFEQM